MRLSRGHQGVETARWSPPAGALRRDRQADDLPAAIRLAYEAADHIRFDGLHRREDIGARALKALG